MVGGVNCAEPAGPPQVLVTLCSELPAMVLELAHNCVAWQPYAYWLPTCVHDTEYDGTPTPGGTPSAAHVVAARMHEGEVSARTTIHSAQDCPTSEMSTAAFTNATRRYGTKEWLQEEKQLSESNHQTQLTCTGRCRTIPYTVTAH